jgi:hypothetical protein
MYDIFFISFGEPNADDHWHLLKSKFSRAKRINGIKGINNAHAACANQSITKMFWTVDADTVVDDDFNFDHTVMPWDEKYLHVWYSRNPINGLEYGYGSIKLWPCAVAKKKPKNWLDFTTTVGKVKIIEQTVSTTMFNTDPFNAWKSGFREAVKLSASIHNQNIEAVSRLRGWFKTNDSVSYSKETVNGVINGVDFFLKNQDNIDQLKLINDFEWLRNKFEQTQPKQNCDTIITTILEELGVHNV